MVPGSGLPSLSKLKKERKRQNAAIPIEPIHTVIMSNILTYSTSSSFAWVFFILSQAM